jgi:hypothetical protein
MWLSYGTLIAPASSELLVSMSSSHSLGGWNRVLATSHHGVRLRRAHRCYEDLSAVKPGMTRREIEKRISVDGGLSADTCECEDFVHPDGLCLKIRIGFDVKHDDQNRPIRSQDDVVVDVSVPFVEEFFCD